MIDKAQLLADFKAARKQGLQPMVVRIGKGDGTTINAFADTGEEYTVWARTEENGDPLVVYFTPGKVSYAELSTNLQFEVERNDRDQLELKRLYTGVRDSLAGAPLPTNAYDWMHTHESDIEAGKLRASDVFDSGQVLLEYGGTEADLSATGAGHLIQATAGAAISVIKDNLTATAAPTTGDDSGDGYAVGSLWLDTTNDNIYMAIDVSVGTAVWRQLNNTASSSPFTYAAPVIYPNNTTDVLTIGGTSNVAKLGIIGVADQTQLLVRGHSSQTSLLANFQNNTPSTVANISNAGKLYLLDEIEIDGALNHDGTTVGFYGTTPITQPGAAISPIELIASIRSLGLFNSGADVTASLSALTVSGKTQLGVSLSGASSANLPAGTAPSSPAEGDIYNSSTLQALGVFLAGIWQFMPGRLFLSTADAGPSNTNAETSIVGTGIGNTTLPANFLTVGKTILMLTFGHYSTNGSSREIGFRFKLGSTTIAQADLTSTAASGGRTFLAAALLTCRSTGVSGTVYGQGYVFGQNATQGTHTTSAVTVNTTTTQVMGETADFVTSDANSNVTATHTLFLALN